MSRDRLAEDGGFTLIELLVTMVLALLVLGAVLQGGEVFARTSKATGDIAGAQGSARQILRDMTAELRQARSPAPGVSPVAASPVDASGGITRSDLVAATYIGPSDAPGWVRYCATADGHGLLRFQAIGSTMPQLGPCAATAGTAGWDVGTLTTNLEDASLLFDAGTDSCFGYATPCLRRPVDVRTVGIRLALRSSPTDSRRVTLRSAVSLRNRPVTP